MTDRDACIVLNMISGIGWTRISTMRHACGSFANILTASTNDLTGIKGISAKLANAVTDWQNSVKFDEEMNAVANGGVRIITYVDDEYPELLKQIPDPPICLYVRGELPDPNRPAIAVVGSRRMTNYGRKMAQHLAEAAAYAGWTVVSGLAYGIDAVAHEATLRAGGITAAVIGSGMLRIHPQDHIPLAREICERGALISEFPMEHPATRQTFPRRNRIVSGLCQGVLLVEARINSGALITANLALDQNRLVFAVPGQADNPQAQGCHKLIKQGAKLTERFEDICEEFEFLPGFATMAPGPQQTGADSSTEATIPALELSDAEQQVIAVLRDGDQGMDALSAGTGLPTGKLLATLMQLEIKRLVKQLPGKVFSFIKP